MIGRWLTGLKKRPAPDDTAGEDKPDEKVDRRRSPRIGQYFDCTWVTQYGEQSGRVNSVSLFGCYVESRTTVPDVGTAVHDIVVALPAGALTLQGTVVDATRGVGFAVRFTDLDADTQARLSDLVRG